MGNPLSNEVPINHRHGWVKRATKFGLHILRDDLIVRLSSDYTWRDSLRRPAGLRAGDPGGRPSGVAEPDLFDRVAGGGRSHRALLKRLIEHELEDRLRVRGEAPVRVPRGNVARPADRDHVVRLRCSAPRRGEQRAPARAMRRSNIRRSSSKVMLGSPGSPRMRARMRLRSIG
jgi:hypothetical protein